MCSRTESDRPRGFPAGLGATLFSVALAGLIAVAGPAAAQEAQVAPQEAPPPVARASAVGDGSSLSGLEILRNEFPKTLLFRVVERVNDVSYEEWAKEMLPYGGFIGKAQNEIIPGRRMLAAWYTRFKKENPGKMGLIHFLLGSRNIESFDGRYSAPHWIHYAGTKGLSDVAGSKQATSIRVEDAARLARFASAKPTISICDLGGDGEPDWTACETAELVEARRGSDRIVVERGTYGSPLKSFRAGRTYVAVRAWSDSHKKQSGTTRLWNYNFSSNAPTDASGLTAGEVLARELGSKFAPGGELFPLDGIAFDVFGSAPPRRLGNGADLNGDGEPDSEQQAREAYSLGVYRFATLLREALGPDKIIIGEGWGERHQHNFGILNGMESEGWPRGHADLTMFDWSGGINRHFFWLANAYPKNRFNYFTYKYRIKKVFRGVPFSINRLFMAGAQFADAAVSQAHIARSRSEAAGLDFTFLDEAVKGVDDKPRWLGQPTSAPIRLAKRSPDLLSNRPDEDRAPVAVAGTAGARDGKDSRFQSNSSRVVFRLPKVRIGDGDLTVFMTVRGEPRQGRPAGEGRYMTVRAVDASTGDLLQRYYNYINERDFEFSYMTRDVGGRDVAFEITIAGGEPVWVSGVSAHAAPDAMYRTFQNGIVIANPGAASYEFDLAELSPDIRYRRITGRELQDPKVNNGQNIDGPIVLTKDALFLEKIAD